MTGQPDNYKNQRQGKKDFDLATCFPSSSSFFSFSWAGEGNEGVVLSWLHPARPPRRPPATTVAACWAVLMAPFRRSPPDSSRAAPHTPPPSCMTLAHHTIYAASLSYVRSRATPPASAYPARINGAYRKRYPLFALPNTSMGSIPLSNLSYIKKHTYLL